MFDWEQKDTIRKGAYSDKGNALPRVLLLGDSISLGYTPFVIEKLLERLVLGP